MCADGDRRAPRDRIARWLQHGPRRHHGRQRSNIGEYGTIRPRGTVHGCRGQGGESSVGRRLDGHDQARCADLHQGFSQCAANCVFVDGAGAVYLGQAAHCASTGDGNENNGCSAGSLPLETAATFNRGGSPAASSTVIGTGRLAYSSWLAMRKIGEKDQNACAYNDFALGEGRGEGLRQGRSEPAVLGRPGRRQHHGRPARRPRLRQFQSPHGDLRAFLAEASSRRVSLGPRPGRSCSRSARRQRQRLSRSCRERPRHSVHAGPVPARRQQQFATSDTNRLRPGAFRHRGAQARPRRQPFTANR